MSNFADPISPNLNPELPAPIDVGVGELPIDPETQSQPEGYHPAEFALTMEEMLALLRELPLLKFAELFAPHLLDLLPEIMLKLELPVELLGEMKIDFDLKPEELGAYNFKKLERTSEQDPGFLAFNALFLLSATEIDIATVIAHEGLHAGWFSDDFRVHDEGMTQLMTQEKMKSAYGVSGMKTGYDNWVEEIRSQIGDVSFHELIVLVKQNPEEMLQRLCNLLTVGSVYANPEDSTMLNFTEMEYRLHRALGILARLFPRLIDLHNGANFNDNTTLRFTDYMREQAYRYVAFRTINDPLKLNQIIEMAIANARSESIAEVFEILRQMGFQYLVDLYPTQILNMLMVYLGDPDGSKRFTSNTPGFVEA